MGTVEHVAFSLPDGRSRRWHEVMAWAEAVVGPGLGRPSAFSQPDLHPTADVVAVTVEIRTELTSAAVPHVAVVDGTGVDVRAPGWLPRWSPDGARLAHLDEAGLRIDGAQVPLVGRAECLAWSPDGSRLLVVLAEPGAEVSGAGGSGLVPQHDEADRWLPVVLSGTQPRGWRRLLVVDATTLQVTTVGRADLNVWDACWAGPRAVAAVCSDGSPTESAWYTADVRLLEVETGADRVLVRPTRQVGPISGSPSGTAVAWVEAVCSDRDIAAGVLHLVDVATGADRELDLGVDVTDVALLDDERLGVVGVRDLTTVVGTASAVGGTEVLWQAEQDSVPGFQPVASFRAGRAAFVRSGFRRPPEMCLLHEGRLSVLASSATSGTEGMAARLGTTEQRRWHAPDGWEISGFLHLPDRPGPHPLVVSVHGGPVLSLRGNWLFPSAIPLLLEAGYAVLQPNPRGSSGKGLEFAAAVVGDMGGADAQDITSGVQALVDEGLVDRTRVGVVGGSYGGFMTAWLVTQTDLFAAAVAMHPVTDWVVQHGAGNLGAWDELFLDGKPWVPDGQYRERSPMTHVRAVSTPTLFIAGRRDRATPPDQALLMHSALVDLGVPSECVLHLEEGHGARDLSAAVDNLARIVDWFETFMPATAPDGQQ